MEVVFNNVTKRYGATVAVGNLNLTIQKGALHFLLGPSGCGKTTTLRMLAGLESVSEGRILFNGQDVTKVPAAERGIGMVFQNYALWPHMTVRKNIEYGLKLRKLPKVELERRIDDVLQITQLGRFVDRTPGQLSGGQQQRVALARALAIRPNVLLLDEPLSNLDAKLRHEMRENITRIHKQTGITTVYVTHDQKEALSMGTSISIMHAGYLIQTATPRALYHSPDTPFIAGFIGETNIISGTYQGFDHNEHLVKTKLGVLRATRTQGHFKPGAEVFISIRPEAIHLADQGSTSSGNVVHLNVNEVTYLGDKDQIVFSHGDQILKLNLFNVVDHGLAEGDAAPIHLPKSSMIVLPPDQHLGAGT